MGDENTTTSDSGPGDSEAAVLDEFGKNLQAFGGDIRTTASVVRRLDPGTRRRVLIDACARCRTFGDLGHDAARAIETMLSLWEDDPS